MLRLSRKRKKKISPFIIPNQLIDLLKINVTEKNMKNNLSFLSVERRYLSILAKAKTLCGNMVIDLILSNLKMCNTIITKTKLTFITLTTKPCSEFLHKSQSAKMEKPCHRTA